MAASAVDMGKGYVRFKLLDDLALDLVGRTVARVPVARHIANYQAARALLGKGKNRAKKGRQKVRGEEGEIKKVALTTAFTLQGCAAQLQNASTERGGYNIRVIRGESWLRLRLR